MWQVSKILFQRDVQKYYFRGMCSLEMLYESRNPAKACLMWQVLKILFQRDVQKYYFRGMCSLEMLYGHVHVVYPARSAIG